MMVNKDEKYNAIQNTVTCNALPVITTRARHHPQSLIKFSELQATRACKRFPMSLR